MKQLQCEHCHEMFEVSNEIADAMHRWRDASGEPFTCGECAGTLDEIDTPDNDLVGASVLLGGFPTLAICRSEFHSRSLAEKTDGENTPATQMPIPGA